MISRLLLCSFPLLLSCVVFICVCSKSTFLNVLCGKATYGVQSGKVFLNDVETQVSSVKSVMGFVPQDDVLHSDLTCYENLHYQAMLRLPKSMKHAQKMRIVDDTIRMLGLEAIKHSVVGSVEKRGISGGQRKVRRGTQRREGERQRDGCGIALPPLLLIISSSAHFSLVALCSVCSVSVPAACEHRHGDLQLAHSAVHGWSDTPRTAQIQAATQTDERT